MTRDPLAGVQTALEEAREYFRSRAGVEEVRMIGGWDRNISNDEARLLTEVEVGLTLLREVRDQQRKEAA